MGYRVALMAVLSYSSQEAFEYWHTGTGRYFLITILIFGCFAIFSQRDDSDNHEPIEFSEASKPIVFRIAQAGKKK